MCQEKFLENCLRQIKAHNLSEIGMPQEFVHGRGRISFVKRRDTGQGKFARKLGNGIADRIVDDDQFWTQVAQDSKIQIAHSLGNVTFHLTYTKTGLEVSLVSF